MNKKQKSITITLIILFILAISFGITKKLNITTIENKINKKEVLESSSTKIYDVILFFGQSNMVGSMSKCRYRNPGTIGLQDYLIGTKIDSDIAKNTWVTNVTHPQISPNTGFEFKTLSKTEKLFDLSKFNSGNKDPVYYEGDQTDGCGYTGARKYEVNFYNGELLFYNSTTNEFITDKDEQKGLTAVFSNANGTNMLPEFAKTYYEKTGHIVVGVMAARGGQPLANFAPGTDKYKAMIKKYNEAVKYLESDNKTIGNKYFVMFQGENESGTPKLENLNVTAYKSTFNSIKNNLKIDANITKGSIIYTGYRPNSSSATSNVVKAVHKAHQELIKEDDNVIEGSSFAYDHYIPIKEEFDVDATYKSKFNNMSYEDALDYCLKVVGYGETTKTDPNLKVAATADSDNLIHFTSSALAQIGRETATSFATSGIVKINIGASESNLSDIAAQTYTGSAIKPSVTVKFGGNTLVKDTDYTVIYSNNIDVGTATVTVTGTGNYEGQITKSFVINKASMSTAAISDINNKTYTGSALKPSVTVTLNSKTLVKDTDYTVSYANNINVGTATVTVTGTGNYNGTITKKFNITPLSISNATISDISNKTYTGSALKPSITVSLDSKTLEKDTDYTVSYTNNTNIGEATVTVTGTGNYSGTLTKKFNIVTSNKATYTKKDSVYNGEEQTSVTGENVTLSGTIKATNAGSYTAYAVPNSGYAWSDGTTNKKTITWTISSLSIEQGTISNISNKTYTGSAIKPSVTVTLDSKILEKDTDYAVTYTNNTNVGEATVTVTGTGNYSGTLTKKFNIVTSNNTTYTKKDLVYNGEEQTGVTGENVTLTGTIKSTNAGSYTAYAVPNSGYAWSDGTTNKKTITWTISSLSIETGSIDNISNKTYTGSAIKPSVTVTLDSKALVKDTDYTVTYSNNINVGEAIVTVTGIGNYGGTIIKKFNIVPSNTASYSVAEKLIYNGNEQTAATGKNVEFSGTIKATNVGEYTGYVEPKAGYAWSDGTTNRKTINWSIGKISLENGIVSGINDKTYTGSALTQSIILEFDSKTLVKNTDYTVTYSNNINVGTAVIEITGKGVYEGTISKTFNIKRLSIASGEIEIIPDYSYTGIAIEPEINVVVKKRELVPNIDYTVSYTNNVNVGKSNIVVTGINNYTGTLNGTFEIINSTTSSYKMKNRIYTGKSQIGVSGTNVTLSGTIKATNVGNYTAYAVPNSGYAWSDGTTDKKTITWKIDSQSISTSTVEMQKLYVYNGTQIKPEVVVNLDEKELVLNTDYKLEYSNNINPGKAKVKIIGLGNYSGEKEETFTITEAKTAKYIVVENLVYTGKEQVGIEGINVDFEGSVKGIDVNTYSVKITPKVGYAWEDGTKESKNVEWTIEKNDISSILVQEIEPQLYTGEEIKISFDLNTNTKKLIEGKDYKVEYQNNKNVGTSEFKIIGINNYKGEITGKFEIKESPNATYNIVTTLKYNGIKQNGITFKNVDIEGEYSSINSGLYEVTLKPKEGYTWIDGTKDSKTLKWEIKPYEFDINDKEIVNNIEFKNDKLISNISVLGNVLKENQDYIIIKEVDEKNEIITVKLVGKNNFTGVIERQYKMSNNKITEIIENPKTGIKNNIINLIVICFISISSFKILKKYNFIR